LVVIVLVALAPLLGFGVTWWAVRRRSQLGRVWPVALVMLGALASVACWQVENAFFVMSGLDEAALGASKLAALLATLLFVAPLEEAAELSVLWTARRWVRLRQPRDGLFGAIGVAAGFASAQAVLQLLHPSFDLAWARSLLGSFGQLFFAAIWGTVLGTGSRLHLLGVVWFLSMAMHGVFDHIVFGRGQGAFALLVPLLVAMAVVGALAVRDLRRGEAVVAPVDRRLKAPTLRELSRAILRRERPLLVRWIVAGAFVTTGMVLTSLALAIVVGNRMGIDFAAANEDDVRSNGPLMLLAVAIISGFPFAGYLIARASNTTSVLESAMGSLLAIVAVVALLSLTAPVAVVFALAVAPVALALACLGAWFGVRPT
jgi:hypothetical protein